LCEDIDATFDDNDPRHIEILKDLWVYIFPNEPFDRQSNRWKSAGFQKENPILDLKNTGVLALICMGYMAQKYCTETKNLLQKNEKNVSTNYPFAIVGVNICMLLIELLNLRDAKYLSTQAGKIKSINSFIWFCNLSFCQFISFFAFVCLSYRLLGNF
jgi:ELMO/CED-12 family